MSISNGLMINMENKENCEKKRIEWKKNKSSRAVFKNICNDDQPVKRIKLGSEHQQLQPEQKPKADAPPIAEKKRKEWQKNKSSCLVFKDICINQQLQPDPKPKAPVVPVRQASTASKETNYDEDIYQKSIIRYMQAQEVQMDQIKPLYMNKQEQITWLSRSKVVDWVASVSSEYNFSNQTLHLSINYIDRFLSKFSVKIGKLQLVATTAMLIASKIEEVYPTDVGEFAYLTGEAYNERQIHKMEQLMLKALNFEMTQPTIADFIHMLSRRHKMEARTTHLAMYLSELVLLEGRGYLEVRPSKMAAASVALAHHTLDKPKMWPRSLERTVGYTIGQLSPVIKKQQETFICSPSMKEQAITNKYKTEQYDKVALLKPRLLELDDDEE